MLPSGHPLTFQCSNAAVQRRLRLYVGLGTETVIAHPGDSVPQISWLRQFGRSRRSKPNDPSSRLHCKEHDERPGDDWRNIVVILRRFFPPTYRTDAGIGLVGKGAKVISGVRFNMVCDGVYFLQVFLDHQEDKRQAIKTSLGSDQMPTTRFP